MLRWLLILTLALGATELTAVGDSTESSAFAPVDWEQLELTPISDTLYSDSTTKTAFMKRNYQHKQQVIVGSVIMLCVALLMVGMNNYNPRR